MGRFTVVFAAVLLGARCKKAKHPPFVISQNNHPISRCPVITSASAKVQVSATCSPGYQRSWAGDGTKKVTAGCRGGGREPGQDVRGETTPIVNNFDPNDVAAKR